MRCLAALCVVAATALRAQEPVLPPPDSTRAESVRAVQAPPPPPTSPVPPTPEQQRFLNGLRTATRGIAQLKDGLSRVTRAQATGSGTSQARAGHFLAGLCGSARAFMRRGRPALNPSVYPDSLQLTARRLVTQLDSLIGFTPNCEQNAAAAPVPTATDLGKRMKAYDMSLRDFRVALGLPVKDDSSKTSKRP
jgi:hypothetical protein